MLNWINHSTSFGQQPRAELDGMELRITMHMDAKDRCELSIVRYTPFGQRTHRLDTVRSELFATVADAKRAAEEWVKGIAEGNAER